MRFCAVLFLRGTLGRQSHALAWLRNIGKGLREVRSRIGSSSACLPAFVRRCAPVNGTDAEAGSWAPAVAGSHQWAMQQHRSSNSSSYALLLGQQLSLHLLDIPAALSNRRLRLHTRRQACCHKDDAGRGRAAGLCVGAGGAWR